MFKDIELSKAIMMFLPVVILHFALAAVAIVNLVKRRKVRFNNKFLWGAIIILLEVFGPILYFLLRGDEQ